MEDTFEVRHIGGAQVGISRAIFFFFLFSYENSGMFFRSKFDFLFWCKPSSTCATCRCKRACFPVVWVSVSQPHESFSPELLSAFSAVLLSRLRLKFYPILVNVAYMFEQTMLSL